MNSTLEVPAGSSSLPANPHETTTRWKGSTHEVLTSHRGAGDIDRELSTRSRIEIGVLPHPRRHALVGGEVLEDRLRGASISMES